MYFTYIFRFFQNYFEKKNYFLRCSNTLTQLLHLKFFLGIFWSRTVFVFLEALTKKKSARCRKFSTTTSDRLKPLWSIPRFHVYTMNPCRCHEPIPITRVIVHTMSPEIFKEIQRICYRNKVFISEEIQVTGLQKYKLQKYQNTNSK